MKTVLLIRHAKSSWDNLSVADIDRTLNDRGKRNAPEMAKRLLHKGLKVDALISSPAVRARKTAELFAGELDIKKKDIIIVQDLYDATANAFTNAITNAPHSADTIAVFSHNPGITDYVNSLTNTKVDNMPTSAIFAVACDIQTWSEFAAAEKRFLFFDYPKSGKEKD
jgi:phosphohistidine phosphatase